MWILLSLSGTGVWCPVRVSSDLPSILLFMTTKQHVAVHVPSTHVWQLQDDIPSSSVHRYYEKWVCVNVEHGVLYDESLHVYPMGRMDPNGVEFCERAARFRHDYEQQQKTLRDIVRARDRANELIREVREQQELIVKRMTDRGHPAHRFRSVLTQIDSLPSQIDLEKLADFSGSARESFLQLIKSRSDMCQSLLAGIKETFANIDAIEKSAEEAEKEKNMSLLVQ